LPAFEASIKRAKSGSMMCAKNRVNGPFSCESAELLTNILKGAWGFDGFVVSDFNSCHNTVNCTNNEMEFELPSARFFGPALKAASPIDGTQARVGPGVAVSYAPGVATSGVSAVPAAAMTGLTAAYFANPTFTDPPVLTRAEERIVNDYGGGAPVAGLPMDGF